MRRVRRNSPDARLDMTPLLDVVFLLLTFFIVWLVGMVPAKYWSVRLPTLSGADEDAPPRRTVTVALNATGAISVDENPVELDALIGLLRERLDASPGSSIVLAIDDDCPSGDLLRVMNELRGAGLGDLGLLGRLEGAP